MKKIIIIFILILCLFIISISTFANDDISSSLNNAEIEIQKGIVGRWNKCGDNFSLMILYQPIMTKSQSYQTAEGMFILFRVLISNDTENVYSGLKNESFTLSKELNGKYYDFPLSGGHSRLTSKSWEIDTIQDEIIGLSQKDTFLVFDVDGKKDDKWILTFSPVEKNKEEKICIIKISLPEIIFE